MTDEKTVDSMLPPIGAFPGYKFGRSLFTAWMSALEEQANLWNDNWSKLVAGDYEFKDLYQALARSVQASIDSAEQIRLQLMSGGAPPWLTLIWGSGAPVRVRLTQMIDGTHVLSLNLYRLGGGAKPLEASAQPAGAYAATVTLVPDDDVEDGQYVGFLVSDKCAEPLAITTVIVDRPSIP
jgi:hypothetical protein